MKYLIAILMLAGCNTPKEKNIDKYIDSLNKSTQKYIDSSDLVFRSRLDSVLLNIKYSKMHDSLNAIRDKYEIEYLRTGDEKYLRLGNKADDLRVKYADSANKYYIK